jgi:hypothetical protein
MKYLNFISVLLILLLLGCNSSQNGSNSTPNNNSNSIPENSANPVPVNSSNVTKSEEQLRQELLVRERSNPSQFLINNATWKKNLIKQTVIEGTINNTATVANFKDVILNVTYVSQTNTAINTEQIVVYENFLAGKTTPYKIKVNAPSATNSVQIDVKSATPLK